MWFTKDAFDDLSAPDAYGVQFLGAGYAGRVNPGPSWRCERAGVGGLIVERRRRLVRSPVP